MIQEYLPSELLALSVGVRSAILSVDESCVELCLWTFKHVFPDCLREISWTDFDVGDRGRHDARVGRGRILFSFFDLHIWRETGALPRKHISGWHLPCHSLGRLEDVMEGGLKSHLARQHHALSVSCRHLNSEMRTFEYILNMYLNLFMNLNDSPCSPVFCINGTFH